MAVKTLTTSATSYCTVAKFLERYDWRVVADLVTDDSTGATRPASSGALAANTILGDVLKAASGKLESAALIGARYTVADLQAINTGNQAEFIATIVSDIAMPMLYRRRPNVTMPVMPQVAESESLLTALAEGTKIFGFTETMDAGVVDTEIETPVDVESRALMTYNARRLFGRLNNRIWPNGYGSQ